MALTLKCHELVGIVVISRLDNTTNLVSLSNFCSEISRTHTQGFLLLCMLIFRTLQSLTLGPYFPLAGGVPVILVLGKGVCVGDYPTAGGDNIETGYRAYFGSV